MEIIKLPPGELASEDADCIKINETSDGMFSLVASALMACGDGEQQESVALVSSNPYPSYDTAEAAGLAWAETHCVDTIYIEVGGGAEPTRPAGDQNCETAGSTHHLERRRRDRRISRTITPMATTAMMTIRL